MASAELTEPEKALIVGISGPSSSGKTTLARLLQRIFNGVSLDSSLPSSSSSSSAQDDTNGDDNGDKLNTFIIHEDDFYYPDDQIPYTTTPSGKTVQDWDTSAAIDTSFLAQALSYVRVHGHLPPRLQSKEDQNENAGPCVPDLLVTELRREVERRIASAAAAAAAQGSRRPTLVFMEGFLLYAPPEGFEYKATTKTKTEDVEQGVDDHYPTDHNILRPVHAHIGLPLFLPAPYSTVKARREGRSGYVTIGPAPEPPTTAVSSQHEKKEQEEGREIDLEGEDDRPPQNFWTDPPGYVDDIVWPRYVRDHAWLLIDGEGQGEEELEGDIVQRVGEGVDARHDVGVKVAPGKGAVSMEVVLRWAVEEVMNFYLEGE
ncbi:putative nicotinamide riboside kinase [Penicillium brasilianum]|uniref:Putative nicotinamide riboside kinase n=1 Tax=Penicillium brasilianum TaxID=104259 RepID=A0A1S9RYE1_PENBI|nr:putative nicotinamide riboside kinase [Penicillium brasilianum]